MIRKMTKKEILMIKELKQESKILEYEKTLNEIYNSIFNDSDDIFLNDFLKDIHIEKKELKRKTYLPNIHQPIKSELMDIKNTNEFKLEKLTERFELRLTKIEKDIIKISHNNGINVSDEIRKFILSLNKEYVKLSIENEFYLNTERLSIVNKNIEDLKIKYADTFIEKSDYIQTKDYIQNMINERYKIKFTLKEFIMEKKQLDKFLKKYNDYFLEVIF